MLAVLAQVRSHERARNLNGDRLPETLRRIRQRLDSVFEDAIFHGRCNANPAAAIRRKMRETMPPKKAGKFAALPYREASALMQRLREAEGTAARCLEFAVLTAARTSEALLAEWREFDLDAAVWVVPAERMKAGEPHTVHLSPRSIAWACAIGQPFTVSAGRPSRLGRVKRQLRGRWSSRRAWRTAKSTGRRPHTTARTSITSASRC